MAETIVLGHYRRWGGPRQPALSGGSNFRYQPDEQRTAKEFGISSHKGTKGTKAEGVGEGNDHWRVACTAVRQAIAQPNSLTIAHLASPTPSAFVPFVPLW